MADIIGTPGDDNLGGTNTDDTISGLEGNDILTGGDGADLLDGGRGNDSLHAGGGDYVYGGDGDDVIDDHHLVSSLEVPLDQLCLAMRFRRFAHDEGLQGRGRVPGKGMHAGGERDWVGPHRESADAGDRDAQFFGGALDEGINNLADQTCAFRIEGG